MVCIALFAGSKGLVAIVPFWAVIASFVIMLIALFMQDKAYKHYKSAINKNEQDRDNHIRAFVKKSIVPCILAMFIVLLAVIASFCFSLDSEVLPNWQYLFLAAASGGGFCFLSFMHKYCRMISAKAYYSGENTSAKRYKIISVVCFVFMFLSILAFCGALSLNLIEGSANKISKYFNTEPGGDYYLCHQVPT